MARQVVSRNKRKRKEKRRERRRQNRTAFRRWQREVQQCANSLPLSLGDVWTDDPYELRSPALARARPRSPALAAFNAYQTPESFVREMFADDLAAVEYDAELFRESLECRT